MNVADHGVKWRFRGIPLDADHPGAGVVTCEQWREEDLTPDQQAEIDALVVEHLEHRSQDSETFARYGILEHNGIAHRHRWEPLALTLGGQIEGHRCQMCDVWEIPG